MYQEVPRRATLRTSALPPRVKSPIDGLFVGVQECNTEDALPIDSSLVGAFSMLWFGGRAA